MRIISGKRRGLKLTPPASDNITRPTTDRVKESLFNIIQMYLPCNYVLDLFAGSGALGIEALSRGAKHTVFVERDSEMYRLVKKNLSDSGMIDSTTVLNTDSLGFLDRLGENKKNNDLLKSHLSDSIGQGAQKSDFLTGSPQFSTALNQGFDIIFLDPPYNKDFLDSVLNKIFDYDLLSKSGIIVVETEFGGEDVTDSKFEIIKTAKYGKTVITVLRRR